MLISIRKSYISIKLQLFTIMKKHYIYIRSYDNQILSYNWFISASKSKRNSFKNKTLFLK